MISKTKKGVSPVIATALLVGIVITLAGIVFIWAQGFIEEGLQKRGEPIERACATLDFEADVFGTPGNYVLEVNNQADVPLYGFNIKALGQGEAITHELPPAPIESGASRRIDLSETDLTSIREIIVVPILLGQKGNGRESFTCPDSSGIGITLEEI